MSVQKIISFLKLSSSLIFFGRAYQHLFWDAPFRSLLWDQSLMEPLISSIFRISWESYATSMATDSIIQTIIRGHGFLYLVCGVLCLLIRKNSLKSIYGILWIGAFSLVVLAMLLTKNKFYHFTMFFEHAIQFGTPLALIWFIKKQNVDKLIRVLKVLIALTFTCHGIYALGSPFPLPANFVTMMLNILPVSEESARMILMLAAYMDFAVAIFIFIPRLAKAALIYAAFWGLATALARVINGFTYEISWSIIHQYLYAAVYRIPHGLIPLLVYFLLRGNTSKSENIMDLNDLSKDSA